MAQDNSMALEAIQHELARLRARVRTLEGRLANQALVVSNDRGGSRRLRLASDGESVEVE